MRGLREVFSNQSIRFKWLISYLVIILSIMFILTVVDITLFTQSIEKISHSSTEQMLNQVKGNLEFYLRDLERILTYISRDPSVQHVLQTDPSHPRDQAAYQSETERIMRLYADENPEISGLMLISRDGKYVSNNMTAITRVPLTEESWVRKALREPNRIHLISKPIGRNVRSIYEYYRAEDILSVVRAVRNDRNESIGVLLIDFKLKTIDSMLSNIQLGKEGFIFLLDESGEIVYTPENKVAYRINPRFVSDRNQRVTQTIHGEKYQLLYQYMPELKWYLIGVISLDEAFVVIEKIRYYTLIYGALILLLAIFVSYLYTNTITKPISKLRRLMKEAEKGNLEVRFPSKSEDEIGQLGKSFNTMLESIKNLMNLVYVEQQKKKEAEFRAFQSQIKPHFLYNTLDTIHWMALEYGAKEIAKLVTALTHFFRISLSKGKEIIPLKDELKQVESYLIIQSIRYEEKFDYTIECDASLSNHQVIKLILQPIVENAIYHGIKEKREKGLIRVEATIENGLLLLTVEDDGVGIHPDKLSELNRSLAEGRSRDAEQGIGLLNVNERIKLTYGSEYGITMWSERDRGTRVEIRHPIIEI